MQRLPRQGLLRRLRRSVRYGGLRRRRRLLGEHVGNGHLIAVADIQYLLHLRITPARLPLAHRLAGHLQLLGKLLLGQAAAAAHR